MNLRAVGRMLGVVLLLMAGFLVVPCVVALAQGDLESTFAFLASAAV
jgi:hypothetical protein